MVLKWYINSLIEQDELNSEIREIINKSEDKSNDETENRIASRVLIKIGLFPEQLSLKLSIYKEECMSIYRNRFLLSQYDRRQLEYDLLSESV